MKVLILFLSIFSIYICHVICEGNTKYAVKSFPKKVRPYGNGKILINSGKFEFKAKPKTTTKSGKRSYTVFQVVGISKTIQGVPDSPYFPVDQSYDHKPRVKKVLPEYPWSNVRNKRQAVLDAPPVEDGDKNESIVSNVESTTEKTVSTTPMFAAETESIKAEGESAASKTKAVDKKSSASTKIAADTKENTTTIASSVTEETTTEPLNEKPIIRSSDKSSSPKPGKNETTTKQKTSNSTKKEDPKKDKKVTTKSNKKPATKPVANGNAKNKTDSSKGTETRVAGVRAKENNDTKVNPKSKATNTTSKNDKETNSAPRSKDKETKSGDVKPKEKPHVKGRVSAAHKAKGKPKSKKTKNDGVALKSKDTPAEKNKKGNATKSKKNKTQKRRGKNKKRVIKGKGKNKPKNKKKIKKSRKSKPKQGNATRTARKPKAGRRLIAAREALIEDYPYVVSIQKNEQHWCTGSLLNPRLVITTANCLWKASRISRMEIRAGSRHMDRDGQMAGIQEVMKHPGWGLRRSPDNDVALILLDRNIKFSDKVHSVDLPNRVMLPAFDDAWITSWGAERRDGVYDMDTTSLQVYHARLMDREKCNNVTMRFSVIVTENFICLSQTGRNAPCTRDTGAPAVSDGVLWGLASWGIRKLCGTERFPAMFSYTASHSNLDFITNATKFLMSDKRYYPYADRYPLMMRASSEEAKKTV